MKRDPPNAAYRLIQFGGLAVGGVGVYLFHASIAYIVALSVSPDRHVWLLLLLDLLWPTLGIGLGGLLVCVAWCSLRRLSMGTFIVVGLFAWLGLSWLLFIAVDSLTPWIVSDRVADFRWNAYTATAIASGIICMVAGRRLGKRAGLLATDASWWHAGNIKVLCGVIAFLMFMAMSAVFNAVKPWLIPPVRKDVETVGVLVWIGLLVVVWKVGPALLTWLVPPRDASGRLQRRRQALLEKTHQRSDPGGGGF